VHSCDAAAFDQALVGCAKDSFFYAWVADNDKTTQNQECTDSGGFRVSGV